MEFEVKDMSCGHCVMSVTKAVKAVDANAKVEVDLATKKVNVETGKAISDALAEAGFPATA